MTLIATRPAWTAPADEATIDRTAEALRASGFRVFVVDTGAEARLTALAHIPVGSEVHAGASETLREIGLAEHIEQSGDYDAIRPRLFALDRRTQQREMRKLAGAPDTMLGSAQAVTETGSLAFASMSGSQLAPYAQSAGQVILVVGAQKIVPDLDAALERIREHAFPLEDARAQVAYGVHSGINKMLVINREIVPDRVTVILVREALGY